MIPTVSLDAYHAVAHTAGLFSREDRGWVVVSGKDRATYLHGLFSNDIAGLAAGRGCYATYLTAQGRMIADLWIYELGDVILLSTHRDVKDTVLTKLDQFIFTEDVQLGDVTPTFGAIAIAGPEAAAILARLIGQSVDALNDLPEHGNLRASFGDQAVIVLRTSDLGRPGFDLLVDAASADALRTALGAAGAAAVDAATSEAIRIEAGIPKFHQDMDEETIPLEAGIESRAISLTKGCYVGQEVIIRVLHRGHGRVARKLVGLVLDEGPSVDPGTTVTTDAREIGQLTSVTFSPSLNRPIALAYLQRDFLAPGTHVTIGERQATVHALPFVASH